MREHDEQWGWRPTRTKIWRKFIKEVYFIELRTLNGYMNIDVEAEMEKLENEIITHKKNEDKMKGLNSLFNIALVAILMSGCGLFQNGIFNPAPTDERSLAEVCADSFPCLETYVVDTVFTDPTIWEIPDFDTLFIDTTVCPDSTLIIDTVEVRLPGTTIQVPCPPTIDTTFYLVDSARVKALMEENNKLKSDLEKCRDFNNALNPDNKDLPWWWLAISAVVSFVLGRWKKKKKE